MVAKLECNPIIIAIYNISYEAWEVSHFLQHYVMLSTTIDNIAADQSTPQHHTSKLKAYGCKLFLIYFSIVLKVLTRHCHGSAYTWKRNRFVCCQLQSQAVMFRLWILDRSRIVCEHIEDNRINRSVTAARGVVYAGWDAFKISLNRSKRSIGVSSLLSLRVGCPPVLPVSTAQPSAIMATKKSFFSHLNWQTDVRH